jgi:hypothetical protein
MLCPAAGWCTTSAVLHRVYCTASVCPSSTQLASNRKETECLKTLKLMLQSVGVYMSPYAAVRTAVVAYSMVQFVLLGDVIAHLGKKITVSAHVPS